MNKRKLKICFLILLIFLILILIYYLVNLNMFYSKAIKDINNNYNILFKDKINLNKDNNIILMGKLKTEHTSNLVHSINQVYEKNYDFILKEDSGKLYIYIDDMFSIIDIDKYYNIFDINNIGKCIYRNKNKEEINANKYSYDCNSYKLNIYTSKYLNNYIKSEIVKDDIVVEFSNNNVKYNSQLLKMNYSNIRDDNYILDMFIKDNIIKMYYTYNNYSKYSFIYNNNRFNIVKDDNIILSMNCDTKRYSKFKLTLMDTKIESRNNYKEIDIDDMLSMILSLDIYELFK